MWVGSLKFTDTLRIRGRSVSWHACGIRFAREAWHARDPGVSGPRGHAISYRVAWRMRHALLAGVATVAGTLTRLGSLEGWGTLHCLGSLVWAGTLPITGRSRQGRATCSWDALVRRHALSFRVTWLPGTLHKKGALVSIGTLARQGSLMTVGTLCCLVRVSTSARYSSTGHIGLGHAFIERVAHILGHAGLLRDYRGVGHARLNGITRTGGHALLRWLAEARVARSNCMGRVGVEARSSCTGLFGLWLAGLLGGSRYLGHAYRHRVAF